MGLIKDTYKIEGLGIELSPAYAIISNLYVDKSGNAKAVFEIQKDRDNALQLDPFETAEVNFIADKDGKIYEQAYLAAKSQTFEGWEDDIVTEETEGGEDATNIE